MHWKQPLNSQIIRQKRVFQTIRGLIISYQYWNFIENTSSNKSTLDYKILIVYFKNVNI